MHDLTFSPALTKTLTMQVVIIGGGISGIATAIRLREFLGTKVDITILEKKGAPGGVWRDSLWPGAGVDVPIHLYSLYSDLSPDWSEVFASQPEVLAYWNGLIEKHKLEDCFRFNSEFLGSAWQEGLQRHAVRVRNPLTGSEQVLQANILVSAAGPLAAPRLPKIPGVETFKGDWFHNLQWNPAVELKGKRIAVIGNGSSGIQLIPGVAALPGVTLTHYVRSGGYFVPKEQRPYSDWEKWAFRWIPGFIHAYRYHLLLRQDKEWAARTLAAGKGRREEEARLLTYLRETAPEKYLPALTPNYPLGTKRTALDLGWLASLHRENVELVNTPITHVRPEGIETADGQLREHDVIIYATGADVAWEGVGVNRQVFGEDGQELRAYWESLGGPQAYAGLAVPHFPNYFVVIGPNATAGSWGWTLGVQSRTIAKIVKAMYEVNLSSVQPRTAPFAEQNARIQEAHRTSAAASTATNNWWRTDTGRITVVNPLRGRELRRSAAHQPRWADWKATRGGEVIDVAAIERERQRKVAGIVLVVLVALWLLFLVAV